MASAVGRLSVQDLRHGPDGPGWTLAHHLGRALQLTNILRDLDEDAEMGRLYLPREALDAAGIDEPRPGDGDRRSAHRRGLPRRGRQAHEHYAAADAVLQARPRGPHPLRRG